jgi:hypothetical protein
MLASARATTLAAALCFACSCAAATPEPSSGASAEPLGAASAAPAPPAPPPEPEGVEQKAAHWAGLLEQPDEQAYAVLRLMAVGSQAQARIRKGTPGPGDVAAMAVVLPALARAYDRALIEPALRTALLRTLVEARAPSARPIAVQIIDRFASGRAQLAEFSLATRYVAENGVKEAGGALMRAFVATHPGDPELAPAFRATRDAMAVIADPAWEPALSAMLARPLPDGSDREAKAEAVDLDQRQRAAAELLGQLRAAGAVRPLFAASLLRERPELAEAADTALLRVGKPAVAPLLAVLAGGDPGGAGKHSVTLAAAAALGAIGRPEAGEPVLAALGSAPDDAQRVALAAELPALARGPAAVKALRAAFEGPTGKKAGPRDTRARAALAASVARWMDSSDVPWLLAQVVAVKRSKGEPELIDQVQQALLLSAIELAKKEQLASLERAVAGDGDDLTKRRAARAVAVARACGDGAACYQARLDESLRERGEAEMTGVKAAFMLAQSGDRGRAAELAKRVPAIRGPALLEATLMAIDHLCPGGDRALAEGLLAAAGLPDAPYPARLRRAAYRLQARAE